MQIKPNKFKTGVLQPYGVHSKKYAWYINANLSNLVFTHLPLQNSGGPIYPIVGTDNV